jgi:hypothetical protein
MSIFKSTLNDEIAAQLKARQHVISSSNRGDDFLRYTSGKNGWVRMTSFVNYNDPKGKYSGDQLSKKYVLEGGTLRQTSAKEFSLRSGVGKYDGVYASDIDKISSNPTDNKVDRMYGLRPMPGITNVNVMNKGAYGSLREATIQFYAWDKHQLEELELLFMRTGYTVFLEWGWSQYITHDKNGSKGINSLPDNIKIKNFDDVTFNPFQSNKISEDAVYKKIDDTVSNARGNYDAMLGFVKNFSWQLMPNGGFQCSTTLISRGEAIETIKASANPYTILGSISSNTSLNEIQPVYSVFEKIFLNIIGHLNETEFAENVSQDSKVRSGQLSFSGIDVPTKDALRDQANTTYNEIQKRLASGNYKQIDRNLDITLTSRDLNTSTVIKPSTGQLEGTAIEYISIRSFLAILNEFFIFKDKNSQDFQPAITILLPNGTECLASEDTVSIDPTTCLIQNSKATFITQTNTGFVPNMFWGMNAPTSFSSDDGTAGSKVTLNEFLIPNTTNRGDISNIFIGINHIIQRYRQLSGGPNGVDIVTLLQTILDDISFALGGINNFKLYNNRNVLQIIDANYLGTAKKEDKFQFDLIGLNSICRDVKINSRVFAEQSTMMAIGAASNNHVNLGDIYSSTQNYFNQGLTDRVLSAAYIEDEAGLKITASDGTVLSGSMAYYITIYNELDSLTSYLQRNVLGTLNDTGYWNVTKVPASSDIINAGSLLKTVHYQLNGKDVNYQAIIPFELEITLDGIGGFIVGQIFTIDKSILPKDYYNKNLGFIITGISHSLQNNDWTTTIKTQICLLENDSIANKYQPDKDKLKSVITAARVQASAEGLLLCAMADLMVHQMFIYFLLDRERTGGTGGYPAPLDKSDLKKAQIVTQLSDVYSYFANKNTLLKLTGDGTTGPETHAIDPRLPVTSDDAILQGVKAFFKGAFNRPGKDPEPNVAYDNSEFIRYATQENYGAFDTDQIEKYLKSWYNAAFKLHGTEQDFPQTYDAFTTISGGAKIDLTGFANIINQKDSIGSTGDIFRDHSFTDSKVLLNAWNSTWIGSTINNTLAGTPYPIPTTNQGDNSTAFKMQHVLFESDKTYTAANSPYHTSYKENEVVQIPISPAWKAGTNYLVYSKYDYTRIAGDGLSAVYSTFFKLLDSRRSSLGLGGNFSTPAGFQYMKYNLEKVLP